MESKYFKITKADADKLGAFEYAPHQAFDPFCSEQKDGTYLVRQEMFDLLFLTEEFQKVEWDKKQLIDTKDLDTKPVDS